MNAVHTVVPPCRLPPHPPIGHVPATIHPDIRARHPPFTRTFMVVCHPIDGRLPGHFRISNGHFKFL